MLDGATKVGEYLQRHIFTPFDQFEQEEVWVLLLNARHHLTHQLMAYRGTVTAATVRPAEIFREAVRLNASMLILAHNHPSGDPHPSDNDVQLTKHLKQVGELLEIQVLDHLVIGKEGWVSLRERQL